MTSCQDKNDFHKIFIISAKFQKKRLEIMKNSMLKKNINYTETLSPDVTHIVSECDSLDQVERQLAKHAQESIPKSAQIVATKWLVECLKESAVVSVADSHMLRKEKITAEDDVQTKSDSAAGFPEWACQRVSILNHLNMKLTDAIETLQEHAELRDADHDYSRALAFRRASSVLKALPFTVHRIEQLKGLKDIGDHAREVIMDVLDHGSSHEVEKISSSAWFKKMKLFTSVFGVGPSTAKTWIECGWENIEDVYKNGCPSSDWRIAWGLAFLSDLNTPVSKKEGILFKGVVEQEAEKILPGVIVTLVGGFRRGKPHGHDVDILLSHHTEGAENGLLPKLLSALSKRGLVLVGHKEKSTFRSDVLFQDFKLSARGQLDHFEKWLGICKFPKSYSSSSTSELDVSHNEPEASCKKSPVNRDAKSAVFNSSNLETETLNCDEHCDNKNINNSYSLEESLNESYEPKVKKLKTKESVDDEPRKLAASCRDWTARRVDLIIAPYSQYYYALVGWTGSKHFNRDARLYAQKKLGLKLTSHGLFDTAKRETLPAKTEEEVFKHLHLPFIDPEDRNC